MSEEIKQVVMYTDGACDPNPGGPGGYAAILRFGNQFKELSGGFRSTTNNRMELLAAIKGLEVLKTTCMVTVYSDSKYLVEAMELGWAKRWENNHWRRNRNETVANIDLWEKLLSLCNFHQVKFIWVRGHAGNQFNERCDSLSTNILKQKNLPPDEGYEHRLNEDIIPKRIVRAGHPCRKCSTPVIKRKPLKNPKQGQKYYYDYYLFCPNCHAIYYVEEAKRFLE